MIWHPDSPIKGFSSHFLKLSVGCGAGFLLCYNGALKCRKFKFLSMISKVGEMTKHIVALNTKKCHLQLVWRFGGCWRGVGRTPWHGFPKTPQGQTGSPPRALCASVLPGWGKCGAGLLLPSLLMTKCFNVAVTVLCSEAWRASRKL